MVSTQISSLLRILLIVWHLVYLLMGGSTRTACVHAFSIGTFLRLDTHILSVHTIHSFIRPLVNTLIHISRDVMTCSA